jgi:hypothetical protein
LLAGGPFQQVEGDVLDGGEVGLSIGAQKGPCIGVQKGLRLNVGAI